MTRVVGEQLYKKLEKELQEKKKEMVHIIDVSNRAYEAREAAVEEMARLKQQADREHQVWEPATALGSCASLGAFPGA